MLDEMRSFVLLAETGSIQMTAERLPLTQSAVTRQIQRLETELGTILLDRRVKPPRLTPAGIEALERCRAILGAIGALKASTAATAEPEGTLRIGFASALAAETIADAVRAVRQQFPKVELRVVGGWARDLADLVLEDKLDAAVMLTAQGAPMPSPGLRSETIGGERMVVVGPSGRPLPRKPTRAALGAMDWVLSPEPCDARYALAALLASAGATMRIAAEVLGLDLQTALIAQGVGIGMVPARRLEPYARRHGLKRLAIPDMPLDFDIRLVRGPHLGRIDQAVDVIRDRLTKAWTGPEAGGPARAAG
ncbi:LysR family transcriptional regulator [Phreatobacter stygius]|nr:LysR family transcriptional regulator [Phreatobacter stygius]